MKKSSLFLIALIIGLSILSFDPVIQKSYSFSSCGTSPSNVLYCVPITLTNLQTPSTASNLPISLTVNWNTYNSYLASNIQNVVWYTGSGSILNAWCESSCSNTATASIVWINLASNTITGSGGTLTVYLGIYSQSTNNLSPSGNWGEYPTATATYAQYDNGINVFNQYYNFAGTSLPSSWVVDSYAGTGGSYTVNNGITLTISVSTQSIELHNTNVVNPQSSVFDLYGYASQQKVFFGLSGLGENIEGTHAINIGAYSGCSASDYCLQADNSATFTTTSIAAFNTNLHVFSLWETGSAEQASIDYGSTYSDSTGFTSSTSLYQQLFVGYNTANGNLFVQWARVRISPPNGIMPSVSFGTFSIIGGASVNNIATATNNLGTSVSATVKVDAANDVILAAFLVGYSTSTNCNVAPNLSISDNSSFTYVQEVYAQACGLQSGSTAPQVYVYVADATSSGHETVTFTTTSNEGTPYGIMLYDITMPDNNWQSGIKTANASSSNSANVQLPNNLNYSYSGSFIISFVSSVEGNAAGATSIAPSGSWQTSYTNTPPYDQSGTNHYFGAAGYNLDLAINTNTLMPWTQPSSSTNYEFVEAAILIPYVVPITITVTGWNVPGAANLGYGVIFLSFLLIPTYVIAEISLYRRKSHMVGTKFYLLFILIGLLFSSLIGSITGHLPIALTPIFGSILAIYLWRGRRHDTQT